MKKQFVPKTLERIDGFKVVFCSNLFIGISRHWTNFVLLLQNLKILKIRVQDFQCSMRCARFWTFHEICKILNVSWDLQDFKHLLRFARFWTFHEICKILNISWDLRDFEHFIRFARFWTFLRDFQDFKHFMSFARFWIWTFN